jgi:hypothetical protein
MRAKNRCSLGELHFSHRTGNPEESELALKESPSDDQLGKRLFATSASLLG